jgi:hypothetical protein
MHGRAMHEGGDLQVLSIEVMTLQRFQSSATAASTIVARFGGAGCLF